MAETLQTKQDLSALADKLFVVLLEVERNEKYLREIPYQEVGNGFAYICQIRHMDPSGNGFMSAAITKSLAESNEWDIDEIFRIAISNTLENAAPKLYRMNDAIFGNAQNLLDGSSHDCTDLLVLTNPSQTFGAASLFLPDVIDKIHACLDNNFYAIPSSIHEFIIVPESLEINITSDSHVQRSKHNGCRKERHPV